MALIPYIPKVERSVRAIGSNPHYFHLVSTGRLSGYVRFVSNLQGGSGRAADVFAQLTWRSPTGSFDRFVGYHGFIEVVYRAESRSGGPTIEVVNNVLRTFGTIHFPAG